MVDVAKRHRSRENSLHPAAKAGTLNESSPGPRVRTGLTTRMHENGIKPHCHPTDAGGTRRVAPARCRADNRPKRERQRTRAGRSQVRPTKDSPTTER